MKKAIFIIAGIAVVGLAVYFIVVNNQEKRASSDTFILPEMKVMTLQIKSLEDEQIMLEVQVQIDNKMPVAFQVDSVSYRVLMEGEEIAKSTYPNSISLGANERSELSLPLTLYQQQISSTMEQIAQQNEDSIAYDFYTQVYTDLPFMEGEPIELDFSSKVPFIRRVEVNLEGASIQKFGLEESEVTLTLQVINPNQFAFQASSTDYHFNVDGDSLISGKMDEAIDINPHDTTNIEIPIQLKLGEVGESAFNLLFNPKQANYSFTVSTTLVSQLDMLNNSKLKIENSGKLKELVN